MTPSPSVLISVRSQAPAGRDLRDRLAGWVRDLGFVPAVAVDGHQTSAWVRERAFAASLLECGVEAEVGVEVWRSVHQVLGRRLVLMVREPRKDVWFEALRRGVGAVLPLPPQGRMVEAALRAATGRGVLPVTRSLPSA